MTSLDDGLQFKGDNTGVVVKRKLGETFSALGRATGTTTTKDSINTTADGSVKVQLVKDIKLGSDGSIKADVGSNQISLDGTNGQVKIGDGLNGNSQTVLGNNKINVGGNKPITIDGTAGTITGLTNGLDGVTGLTGKNGTDELDAINTAPLQHRQGDKNQH